MSDLINIGTGVTAITSYSGGNANNPYYKKSNQKINPQFAKLRIGEIVQGLIIEEPINNIAEVRLPVGIFKAILHGHLYKGDKLFFRIEETSPNLVLKIYSVSLYKEKSKLVPDEILRILDLPVEDDFINICSEYSQLKPQIVRDEILICYNSLSKYASTKNTSNFDKPNIRNSIFITDLGIAVDQDIYNNFLEYFLDKDNYIASINQIKNNISKFSNNIQIELNNYINSRFNSSLPNSRLSVVV